MTRMGRLSGACSLTRVLSPHSNGCGISYGMSVRNEAFSINTRTTDNMKETIQPELSFQSPRKLFNQ